MGSTFDRQIEDLVSPTKLGRIKDLFREVQARACLQTQEVRLNWAE